MSKVVPVGTQPSTVFNLSDWASVDRLHITIEDAEQSAKEDEEWLFDRMVLTSWAMSESYGSIHFSSPIRIFITSAYEECLEMIVDFIFLEYVDEVHFPKENGSQRGRWYGRTHRVAGPLECLCQSAEP